MVELSPALVAALGGVAFLVLLGLSVLVGLYVAERQKTEILENVANYGRTKKPEARDLTPEDPEMEAKKRAEIEAVNNAVERLAAEIKKRAKKKGQNVTNEEARQEARRMLKDAHEKAGGSHG